MGRTGIGPFENDAAADWLAELRERVDAELASVPAGLNPLAPDRARAAIAVWSTLRRAGVAIGDLTQVQTFAAGVLSQEPGSLEGRLMRRMLVRELTYASAPATAGARYLGPPRSSLAVRSLVESNLGERSGADAKPGLDMPPGYAISAPVVVAVPARGDDPDSNLALSARPKYRGP